MSNCTRKHIVEQARAWIGLNEADGTHKQIVDIYNSHKPLARGYELQYTDPWCAGFASALAIICKATDIVPIEVSCNKMIEIAKAMVIWVEADNHIPSPGDFVVYDWQDKTAGNGDCQGNPDHIGVCEYVVGDSITVIEGNFKNAVGRRLIKVNGNYIRGYITPHYADEPVKETKTETTSTVKVKTLKKGSKGSNVKAMQILLMGYNFYCGGYGADGDFGSGTESAVRAFQKAKGLTVDGVCGPKTWAKLLGV